MSSSCAWSCWKFSLARSSGIVLRDREEPADRGREDVLGLGLLLDRPGLLRARPGLRDLLERRALVLRVALDRLDEVRDQVVAAAELDVDLRPGVVDAVPQPDEPVVEDDEREPEEDGDRDADDDPGHGCELTARSAATHIESSPPR